MQFDLSLFLTALGLAMVLEGLPYFLWAEKMPSILLLIASKKPSFLRGMGMLSVLLGLALIFLARL
ncbi:MAG: DUF2065 domain-containing protein [Desulfovibrionales bacterium]